MTAIRTLIMGAAGRDFHNFNVFFRDNADYEVVAFTATQIPNIEGRKYPAALAGKLYPNGINIPWTTPPIIAGCLVSGWQGALLNVVQIIVSGPHLLPVLPGC